MKTEEVRRTTLDCGLRVVTEAMPELRSVTVGFWVGTGARDEPDESAGASHFLEHLLFKGTPTRSAIEIAQAVESVGGEMNAFTTKEYTAFYIRILDESLPLAIDILSDVIWSPTLESHQIESERQVILEEIRMTEDAPDELAHELFSKALYPGHPLGRQVLGTEPTIQSMGRSVITGYHDAHYRPENLVVSVAGNLRHEEVVDRVERRLVGKVGGREPRIATGAAERASSVSVLTRATEQAHLVLGMPALSWDDPDRYALEIVNQVLGGGMSSRLFQEVRERRGLAYEVYSHRGAYDDGGYLAIYAGTAPARAQTVLNVIHGELDRLFDEGGVGEVELANAKGHVRGAMALGLEESAARMSRLARTELTTGEILTLDEVVSRFDAVTTDDLERVIDRVFRPHNRVLAAVGPFAQDAFASYVRDSDPA